MFQVSSTVLDDMHDMLKPLELTVEELVTDVTSDLQESIDCTVMAVDKVLSLGEIFEIHPEYERRCKGVLKAYVVIPQDKNKLLTQQTDARNAHRSQIIEEMIRGNEDTAKSVIKSEPDRVFVISRMIRRELDNLSAETKKEFNIHDIDLEHISVQQVLREIGALYKVQQSNRSSARANEIRHLFDKILEILRLNNTGGRGYSDDAEVNEIFKNLKEQENDSLIDIEKKLLIWHEDDPQENIVRNENVNKLQREIDNIPKTFRDIANKIFNQGSTNGIPQEKYYVSNGFQARVDDIINDSDKESQNVDVAKIIQGAARKIMVDSQLVDTDQLLKSTEEATNTFSQPTNQREKYYDTNSVQNSRNDTFKDSGKESQNIDVAKIFQDAANQIMGDSQPVDTDQIVKTTEEATNIFSQPIDQREKSYDTNSVQGNVDLMFKDSGKESQNVDVAKIFQDAASELMVDSQPVDTDQIVKSTEEARNISPPENQHENWHTFQENFNNMLKNSKSNPDQSEPVQALDNININAPFSQIDMPTAPSMPPTSEIPDDDEYNKRADIDELSFFSHLFGSD